LTEYAENNHSNLFMDSFSKTFLFVITLVSSDQHVHTNDLWLGF